MKGLIRFYLKAPGFMGGGEDKAFAMAERIGPLDKLEGYRELGRAYEETDRFDEATKVYEEAIAATPKSIEFHKKLGLVHQSRQRLDQAFETYAAAIKIDPEAMGVHYQFGKLAAMTNSELDRGEASLKKYIGHQPEENMPSLAWAHHRLGNVYEKKNEKDLARAEYEAAVMLDPEHEEAKKALAGL